MNANLLAITARKKSPLFGIADVADFEFSEGPGIDPQVVLNNPLVSLYCLDHANRRALFVETPSGIDLSRFPFFYQAQYENALNLIGVPYETLHQLADGTVLDDQRVILVYSTGRTGSTLLGAALNAAESVVNISEPDVFTQLVAYREGDGSNDADISKLVKSCLKLLCRPTQQILNPTRWSIKFRSFSIELGVLLFKHFPNTKNIFLYRHAEAWLNSNKRAFIENAEDIRFRTWFQAWLSTLVPTIAKHVQAGGQLLTVSAMGAMVWLSVMQRYLELNQTGMPGIAIRYKDIKTAPHETLQRIFEYCGLTTTNMEPVYQVLEKDSQAGSAVAQKVLTQKKYILTEADLADLARLLKAHPIIQSPDFVVPATWTP